ncbi:hypothetical protein [Caulobacter sp. 1776]|uniref:hypothetical protein n=1 Tax=Caulobacter sp. 1776 TaxID=3156420 RepID=UPI00339AB677
MSAPLAAISIDAGVDVPSPALQRQRRFAPALDAGMWSVPLEVLLALPASSIIQQLVIKRVQGGTPVQPTGQLLRRHGRFFATVDFDGPGAKSLFFALDVWDRRPSR